MRFLEMIKNINSVQDSEEYLKSEFRNILEPNNLTRRELRMTHEELFGYSMDSHCTSKEIGSYLDSLSTNFSLDEKMVINQNGDIIHQEIYDIVEDSMDKVIRVTSDRVVSKYIDRSLETISIDKYIDNSVNISPDEDVHYESVEEEFFDSICTNSEMEFDEEFNYD